MWVIVGVAFVLTVGGNVLFNRLRKRMPKNGYNDFQGAGSADKVREILAGWGPDGLAAARKAWLLDLVYPISYALLFATLASLCATHADSVGWGAFSTAMDKVSIFAIAAGAVDLLVENPAVGVGLWRTPNDTAAQVARAAGRIKKLLIAVVLLALLGAGVAFLVEKA